VNPFCILVQQMQFSSHPEGHLVSRMPDVRVGAMSVAISLKSLDGIPSGPGDLCGCKLHKSLVTPSTSTLMGG